MIDLGIVKKLPFIGKYITREIIKLEGGEKESLSLRQYCKNTFSVDIGLYTYGSCFSGGFNTGGEVKIGKYCSFGENVHYFGANHPLEHAIMSAYFYNKKFGGLDVFDVERNELRVGHDVWVGYGSIIVSTCHCVGNGSVIAAGSVVTKDVPAYAIVGGVPARVIRYRFDKVIQRKLEESKWWELKPKELYDFYDKINYPSIWADEIIAFRKNNNGLSSIISD